MRKKRFPSGFFIGAASAGIKDNDKDVGVIYCPCGFRAAALFTKNRFKAAPVVISEKHLPLGKVLVVNSGVANAATGEKGLRDAMEIASYAGKQFDASPEEVLMASTGVIGKILPLQKIKAGIKNIKESFLSKPVSPDDFAQSILTTDTKRKTVWTENFWACAKGSGMICPDMATFLCFIVTDAAFPKGKEKSILRECAQPFNRMTVDGEMSTNDTVFLLSSGIRNVPREASALSKELLYVCAHLAEKIIDDGEGRHKVIDISVRGAKSFYEAKKTALHLATSPLIKTAFNGESPNWGRILSRAGSLNVRMRSEKVRITICGVKVFAAGQGGAKNFNVRALKGRLKKKNVSLEIDLGAGVAGCVYRTTDLSCEYVKINAGYLT